MDVSTDTGQRAARAYLAAGGGQSGIHAAFAVLPGKGEAGAASIVAAERSFLSAVRGLPIRADARRC